MTQARPKGQRAGGIYCLAKGGGGGGGGDGGRTGGAGSGSG